jgi:hypothetical protein
VPIAAAGSSETIASTPAAASRSTSSGAFAVQPSTGTPRLWAAATADGPQSVWWSARAVARERRSSGGTRTGIAARSAVAPARVSPAGQAKCETP